MIKSLKIYHTSDIHGSFYPTTYGDEVLKNVGLFSGVSRIEKDGNTLIIDGGDILQGNAFAYYTRNIEYSSKIIADIMNDCGYDYFVLGNHDFNYGPEYQEEYIRNHHGKCITENITDKDGNVLYPYDIKIMENGLKVGIVGIVTDYINVWEKKANLSKVNVTAPFNAAKKALEDMRGKTDINICVYHGGFEADLETGRVLSESTENIGYKICKELDFDILLTGHQHMSVAPAFVEGKNGHRTFVVQPLDFAKEINYLNVNVETKEGGKKITINSEKIKADHNFAKGAVSKVDGKNLYEKYYPYQKKVLAWLDEPVGEISEELRPGDRLGMALTGSKIADFFNKVQIHFSGAQISAVGLANELSGFDKTVKNKDIIATYPYPNTLVVLEISGKQLKEAIERTACYFDIKDDEVVISDKFLYPKVEHYNYDYFYNIDYHIDPYKPTGARVVRLKYDGRDIREDEVFTLCINNYRATGAGDYPMYPKCKKVKEINVEMVELLMEYFEKYKYITI